ncbi:hypothetical protein TL16_g13095 [Triparma laevis f. inornata]|uniref:WW domain-containing protein n=1 Tax=Triparma laevis f. inornata TaxID=1714386 RepID=A0A9W7EYJ4_9STRA|nr:hypothetical protein TL16_g13095 [Triparma laevis f. inornata]
MHCLGEHHCAGGNDPENSCEYGYVGPLCAVCSDGFASVGSGADMHCNVCEGSAFLTIAVGCIIIALVILGIVFWCCRSSKNGEKVEEKGLIGADSLEDQATRLRSASEAARAKVEAVTGFIENAQPYFKILLAYFQVAGGLSFAFRLRFPPMFTDFMNLAKGVLSLDVLSLMPIGCITSNSNFHYSMLAYTFIPFSIGVVMVALYSLLRLKHSDSAKQLANKIFGAFLALSFIILPSVSIKIFSNFACHEFDGGYGSYLKVDYSINCDGTEHKVFNIYALVCIVVYPIGIPLMYFLLLRRERKLLDPGQRHFTFQLGSEEKGLEKALQERAKIEEKHPEVLRLAFLYRNYEPMSYNFEVFETLRKLILTGGLIFLKPGTGAQIVMAMLMCLAAMRVYAAKKPFVEHDIDTLSEAAQWQLFFVMFSALAIRVNLDGESLQDQEIFDWMMLIMQFLAPAIMVVAKIYKASRRGVGGMLEEGGANNMIALGDSAKGMRDELGGGGGGEDEDEENGLQLTNIFSGMSRGAVLGGGPAMPRTSKFDVGNPLTNPPSKNGKQTIKASGLLKVDSKGNVGPSNAGRPKTLSRPNSSFNTFKNPNLALGGKVGSKKNRKNIEKEAPKRKSMFSIPKEHLEDAPIGPPKIPPPIPEDEDDDDDDVGPPPFPPPAAEASLPPPKPVCQWTEEWDAEFRAIYYLNIDGFTSTWDMPDDFWREEKR